MESKEKFGQFMIQKRKEQNMTQKELAAKLFVTESAISKWERGISYPDISIISAICRELHITERELINASEDYQMREIEKQAKGFKRIIKTYSSIFYGGYAISLLACFIANLATAHKLSWFFIVLTAELTAFSFLNLPVICHEHKGMAFVGGSYFSLNLLLLTCAIYTRGDWFLITFICILTGYILVFLPLILKNVMKPIGIGNHKALLCVAADTVLVYIMVILCSKVGGNLSWSEIGTKTIPLVSIGALIPWLFLLVIRYLPVNGYFKTAINTSIIAVYALFVDGVINQILSGEFRMEKTNLFLWNEDYVSGNVKMIVFLSLLFVSVVFVIAGIASVEKKNQSCT